MFGLFSHFDECTCWGCLVNKWLGHDGCSYERGRCITHNRDGSFKSNMSIKTKKNKENLESSIKTDIHFDEKDTITKETYTCRIKCSNCNYGYPDEDDMEIQKGIKEKEWSSGIECPRCGCKGTLYFYGGCY